MPLNFRIFKKKPQPGKPLAIDGMAAALNFMARAWETLDVWRGRVDWNDGRPLIIVDGLDEVDGSPQLDHAFLPTQTAATTATLTPGNFYDREGVRRDISLPGQNWNDGNINFATNRYWYAQIRYWDDQSENEGVFRDLRWFSDTTAFPVFRLSAFTENIPIIEFPDGTWASMIRRQTNDWFGGVKGATGEQGIQGPPGDDADCGDLYGPDNPPPPPDYGDIPGTPDIPENGDFLHASLGDIADGDAGDDHSGTNYNYLANVGDSARNAMTGTIGDADGGLSISAPGRTLTDAAGYESIDWQTRQLHDGTVTNWPSIAWGGRVLYDSDGELSADWHNRVLKESGTTGITSLDYTTQQPAIDPDALDQTAITDATGGTPGATLAAVGDTSAGDESAAINDNLASLAAQLDNARTDNIAMKAEITALRDALKAYKIIATTPPPP